MTTSDPEIFGYQLDDFFLDVRNRQVLYRDRPLSLNSKYFDVLLLLIRHQGRLVTKQQIFEEIWQEVVVTDAALTQCIKDIRKLLGDDFSKPRYIKTVPKHGYIFVAQTIPRNGLEAPVSQLQPTVTAPLRPYKFLDYYTEQEAGLFFGREAEIDVITSQILAHRSFILYGRSGVGKSSLLRAGLMPRLKAQGHHVFVLRGYPSPLSRFVEMVQQVAGSGPSDYHIGELASLAPRLEQHLSGASLIALFDQFEDFFTLLRESDREEFINLLAQLLNHESAVLRLVFALREDRFADMNLLKPVLPEIFHHEFRLQRLSRAQAARAITEPARLAKCSLDEDLVERLLTDLSEENSVDPPQLQIVCDQLYDARDRASRLTSAAYARLGGASQILTDYLDRVLRRFRPTDLLTARELLKALISPEGDRLVLGVRDLEERLGTAGVRGGMPIALLIEELAAARIVRYRNQEGAGWLELAHDFLLPEVSRWITTEELALKRARGVIARAMENYRAHGLLIDADALQLLLPFGTQLGLHGDEADLLLMSLLNRAQPVPEWLVHLAPAAHTVIPTAANNADADVRLRAIEACGWLQNEQIDGILQELAWWDRDMRVRCNATLVLAEHLEDQTEERLSDPSARGRVGWLRQAMSLALLRDYNRVLVKLSRYSMLIRVFILCGLLGFRLRRGRALLIRCGLGGLLGGAVGGLLGGVMLGLGLAVARHTSILQGTSVIVVLASLGAFVSANGGLFVSSGMAIVRQISYRHSRWWSIIGAAIGGAVIGGIGHWLGVSVFQALFGRELVGITGALEGSTIGGALALGVMLADALVPHCRAWHRVVGAALLSMLIAVTLSLVGGTLLSSSLASVGRAFADSQLRMDSLAAMFGEVHFGQLTQMSMSAMEGLIFGGTVAAGVEIALGTHEL